MVFVGASLLAAGESYREQARSYGKHRLSDTIAAFAIRKITP
jgi:hypothetical protein